MSYKYIKYLGIQKNWRERLTTEPKKKGDGIADVATNKVPGFKLRRPDPHLDIKTMPGHLLIILLRYFLNWAHEN